MFRTASIDPDTLSELCETFLVSPKTCEYYNQYYDNNILPRIQKKYLAHLVSSIEDIIDEKIKNDNKKKNSGYVPDEKTREFSIIFSSSPPPGKKATVDCQPKGAVIKFIPSDDFKELRIFIAHELGHVLRHYKIIQGNDPENHANLFAFFAINGKNKFYNEKVPKLIYPNGEKEIISSIDKVHPIRETRQTDN